MICEMTAAGSLQPAYANAPSPTWMMPGSSAVAAVQKEGWPQGAGWADQPVEQRDCSRTGAASTAGAPAHCQVPAAWPEGSGHVAGRPRAPFTRSSIVGRRNVSGACSSEGVGAEAATLVFSSPGGRCAAAGATPASSSSASAATAAGEPRPRRAERMLPAAAMRAPDLRVGGREAGALGQRGNHPAPSGPASVAVPSASERPIWHPRRPERRAGTASGAGAHQGGRLCS